MAQVLVRNLDEEVVDALKKRAVSNGRSLQAELQLILEQAAAVPTVDPVRLTAGIRRLIRKRSQPDSVDLIRADRDR